MKRALVITVLVYASLVPGCGGEAKPFATLSVGTLHTIYAMPLSLAATGNRPTFGPIFQRNGINVNIVYFEDSSQMEDALVAGEIDGALLIDLASAFLLNQESEQVKVVMTTLRPWSRGAPVWTLVKAPGGSSPDLEGQRVAIPKGVTLRYIGHRMLEYERIDPRSVDWLEVSDGWEALAALESGEVSVAMVSEPALSVAVERGVTVVADNRWSLLSQLVVAFRQPLVNESLLALERGKRAAIMEFTRSYEQAIWELNSQADPKEGEREEYRDLMIETGRLSPDMGESLPMPQFPWPADIPTVTEGEDLNQWLLEQGMLSQPVDYLWVVELGLRPPPKEFAPCH